MILAEAINDTTLVLEGIQVGLISLPKVVMDERISLDFLLIGQGRVRAISITSFCVWINISGQVERSIQKLEKRKTTWPLRVDSDGLWDLLSWLVLGLWGPWLRSI